MSDRTAWSTKSLGELAIVSAGQGAPQDANDFDDDGIPFIRAGSLDALVNGGSEDDCERVPARTVEKYRLRLFPAETILFAKSGMSAKKGRVYKLKRPAYVTNHLATVSPSGRAEPDYLLRWLSAFPPTHLIPNESYPSIRLSAVEELKVTIPNDAAEQRRLAAILAKADAIRANRREALTLADELLRASFLDMFGGSGECMTRWPVRPLGELLAFVTSGSRGWARYYQATGATFIRIENVKRGYIDLSEATCVAPPDNAEAKRTRVRPGDVLLSITADLGRCGVVPDDIGEAYVSQHLAILRPASISSDYLSAFLTMPAGQSQFLQLNRSAVKAGLNFDDIRSVKVPIPPDEVQARWSDVTAAARAITERLTAALGDADDLYASLAYRAFRGEL